MIERKVVLIIGLLLASIGSVHASDQWLRFEVGGTYLFQGSSNYTISPEIGYTPRFEVLQLKDWLSLFPRASLQFNKTLSGSLSPLLVVEGGGKVSYESAYFQAQIGLGSVFADSGSSGAFFTMGCDLGYQLKKPENGLLKYVDRIFIGYRRLFSTVGTNQLTAGVGLDF